MEDKIERKPTNMIVGELLTEQDIKDIKKYCIESGMSLQEFVTESIVKYASDLEIIEADIEEE